jgi:hypothetical protein
MGHYASEIDPEWGIVNERANRKAALRREIENLPLSVSAEIFTLSQLPLLLALVDSLHYDRELNDSELTTLEDKLADYKAGQEKRPRD